MIICDRVAARRVTLALPDPVNDLYDTAYLTPFGAVVENDGAVWEWRDGSLIRIGQQLSRIASSRGAWVAWTGGGWSSPVGNGLIRLSLIDRSARAIDGASQHLGGVDLADNGNFVYQVSGFRGAGRRFVFDQDGASITIPIVEGDELPITDGRAVVYRRNVTCATGGRAIDIVKWTESASEVLSQSACVPELSVNDARPYTTHVAESGRLAFLRRDAAGVTQVWVRSADNVDTQVTSHAQPVLLDALAPNGDVMYTSGGRRYLARVGRPALDVGAARGRSLYRDRWYVIVPTALYAVVEAGATTDADADGLPNEWEQRCGLDPTMAAGASGATADPDGDGLTNAQELQQGTHPRGFERRHFAEGATGTFFDTAFALATPSTAPVSVLVHFDRADGTRVSRPLVLQPSSRHTLYATDVLGPGALEFSTMFEADATIIVERTMSWDRRGYGSHSETGVSGPSTDWYLAEGATHSGFQLFYLIQNPGHEGATVRVTYFLPAPAAPAERSYHVAPRSRFNIWVNHEAAALPVLTATDVSARVQSTQPIVVERAMYLDNGSLTWGAGHVSAGVTAPSLRWFFAEGATGPFFDEFLLVANPNPTASVLTARFLVESGNVITRAYTVAARSRLTVWVDTVDPALANASVSATIEVDNDVPVVAERAMWWPGPTAATWQEAHNSAGVTQSGTQWMIAAGEEGGGRGAQTYLLIANTSPFEAYVELYLSLEGGGRVAWSVGIPPMSRRTIPRAVPLSLPSRFSLLVTSLNDAQIVVERATYWDADGTKWAAGSNALGTRLR